MKENIIAAELKKGLEALGLKYRRVEWTGRSGAPDILVLYDKGVWIETKALGQTLRKTQEYEINTMRENGFEVYVVDSLESAVRILRLLKRRLAEDPK